MDPCRLSVLWTHWVLSLLWADSQALARSLYIQYFQYDSGFFPLQCIFWCQCVWQHTWLVVIRVKFSIPGINFKCLLGGLVSCYTIGMHHWWYHNYLFIFVWSFSTIKLRILVTTVDFTTCLVEVLSFYPQLFEACHTLQNCKIFLTPF
jgi:hypothetical protein